MSDNRKSTGFSCEGAVKNPMEQLNNPTQERT